MGILAEYKFQNPAALPLDKSFILPGKFYPLHNGHLHIAHYIKEKFNKNLLFELSLYNPLKDRGTLVLDDRMRGIIRKFNIISRNLIITDDINYVSKSRTSIGATFVIGPEILYRICNPISYFESVKEMLRHLNVIRTNQCKFLVIPRTAEQYEDGVKIPTMIQDIVEYADDFKPIEISSTEIREKLRKIEKQRKINEVVKKLEQKA